MSPNELRIEYRCSTYSGCGEYYGRPDCLCGVFYFDKAECYAPCVGVDVDVDAETSSFSASVSGFTNYFGLAMDAVLCFHCIKNYRDVYPSVFALVMMFMTSGVLTAVLNSVEILNEHTLRDLMGFMLAVLLVQLIIICRYFNDGCGKMGQACCRGNSLKFQFTCFGTGL